MNAQETRNSDFGHPYDEKLSEEIKYHAKQLPMFVSSQLVTFKRLNKECEVLECIEQEHDIRGRLTSPTRYRVKGTFGTMLAFEYELINQ